MRAAGIHMLNPTENCVHVGFSAHGKDAKQMQALNHSISINDGEATCLQKL